MARALPLEKSVAMSLLAVMKRVDPARIQQLHDAAVALGASCHCGKRADALLRFNPNHRGPGERGGQFAPAGEGASGSRSSAREQPMSFHPGGAGRKPAQLADSSQIATDAQIAQEEDKERDDEESNPIGPARAALYNSARSKLNAIDPSNAALKPIVTNPGWTPSKDDLNSMEDALNRAIENHAEAAASYAYEKHVNVQKEFPDIGGQVQLQLLAQDVMRRSPPESIARGRIMFYQSKTNTLVIINPEHPEEDNIFRPDDGPAYVNRLRKGR